MSGVDHGRGLVHRAHGVALRLFWKVVAPTHPRGWLDIHPVLDDAGKTAWLHCHGMERWHLPNIELTDVPVDLLGPAHGILMAITGYMKCEKPIDADETIGGYFNGDGQAVVHRATLRQSPTDMPGHGGMLRVVDLGVPVDAGFPYRLFAVHLVSIASGTGRAVQREALLRRATEIHPGRSRTAPAAIEEAGTNPNNYFAWQDLGLALADQGRDDEAITLLEQAVARWPEGARGFAQHLRKEIEAGNAPPAAANRVSRFWMEVDVDSVAARIHQSWPA